MTRRTASVVFLTGLVSPLRAEDMNRPSADFEVTLTSGRVMKVSDYRGKVLALSFILTT